MTETLDDSRLNLPSASNMHRVVACPGSVRLEELNPETESSEWAERGTRIHEANEKGDVTDLAEDEADIVVRNRQAEERLFNQWVDDFQIDRAGISIRREERIYITNNLAPVASAKLDFLATGLSTNGSVHALVLDLKSGRLEVPVPAANWQLRTSAVAVFREFDACHVRVAITQPLRKASPPCDYDKPALMAAFLLLNHHLLKAREKEAELVLGPHCAFCRGRFICPKVKENESQLLAIKEMSWDAVPATAKPEIFSRAKQARKYLDDLIAKLEAEVDAGLIPGLMRGPGSNVRHITDPIALYTKLRESWGDKITPQKFAEITSIKIGKATKNSPNKGLEDLVRESSGLGANNKPITWDATEEWVNTSCADIIERKQKKGSVIPVTEAKAVEDAK